MKAPSDYFAEGMAARHKGQPIGSCKLLYKAWPWDCWRLGWEFANVVRQVPTACRNEGSLEEVIKTPFEQGICHYYESRLFTDGPYSPGSPDALAWEAGWLCADSGRDLAEPVTSCSLSRRAWWLLIGVGLLAFWLLIVWAII